MIESSVIQEALSVIRDRGANYVYFFRNLSSADWIEPLWNAGFFRKPPVDIRRGDTISFPPWVESEYLARVAVQSPELVVKIINAMEDTENAKVHCDILDIAIKLPPPLTSLIIPKLTYVIRHTFGLLVHGKVVELIKHLATNGNVQDAITISNAALEFRPDPKAAEKQAAQANPEEAIFQRLEPLPRWNTHDYSEILDEGVRLIVQREPLAALRLTSKILNSAIRLSIFDDELNDVSGYDASTGWRPAVEEHGQNNDYHAKQLLVPVIRDAAVLFLESNPDQFQTIEDILHKFHWDIFTRIYVHLCRVCAKAAGEKRINTLLSDHKFFNNYRFTHEWSLLLSEQFKNLSLEAKNKILGWIDSDFDAGARINYYRQTKGQDPTPEMLQGWKNRWQRDRLSFIADDLPGDYKQRYQSFVDRYGPSEHPDFPIWSSGVVSGSTSPISSDQLLAMPIRDLFNYLKNWKPSEDPFGPSIDGLAATFQSVVKSKPEQFVAALEEIKHLNHSYVKVVIRSLSEVTVEGKEIVWAPLLELCSWVLEKSLSTESIADTDERRDEWQWTRMEIIRLVSDSLKREKGKIPCEFREIIWRILTFAVNDPIPSPNYEKRYANGGQYGTLSMNTNRGEAIHALFNYANWVRKHTQAPSNINPATEILEPLSAHLDLEKEPTLTIRSVYSQYLPWLLYFHPDWLKSNLVKIFPKDKPLQDYYNVAWQTYIVYCNAWVPLFNALRSEYELAVERVAQHKGDRRDFDLQHPDNALAQHLVTLYWWGELSIDDPDSLISRFFSKAPDSVRSHAIEYAGRSVWNTTGDVPIEILNRLQHLYDTRLNAAENNHGAFSFEKELSAFGPWVYSKKFDEGWTLNALERTLKLTKDQEHLPGYTLERLSELSDRFPLQTVKCLKLIILSGDQRSGWQFETNKIKQILSNAQKSANREASDIAAEVRDWLLRNGMFDFRKLD